ncbi:MAG TPA: ribonuclease E/G [Allosphingosinicella sp.]|uniref:Rne/Rng family ribonuclease n=1 Tax=Allosphingosinicella sp. TaxID=2823234 RepID=UPI002EDB2283
MTMRMLIDARHQEETRVAVVKGNRIEEFDFESAEHKQLKGNIYLAKVTRVEPSLQAAFVDYGGNRHGFLAFSEIHPDYYQIPKEDREALLREEAEHAAEEERLRAAEEDHHDDDHLDDEEHDEPELEAASDEAEAEGSDEDGPKPKSTVSGREESAADELRRKRQALRRRYKIQDVIRRRQVLLVQVVKEERGNKGAALTTYLSLAGRYCVLMPNTSHGGGISRKISNGADRKRLKQIMAELNLPKTMGCIVRTAGLSRTKTEIKRDFDYLARLWDEIRDKTLKSSAPALIYQDSDLIKRAIRDIYNRDIEEVIVEGEEGYKHARAFMKLLMPSHVRRVKAYADTVPLFQRGGVEDQLSAMYQPLVQLKSGGYLVINPTEALVSIDINSGRSTREHNIEQTAFATNIEAAHEIARQLRLRDMAGLVVIDFIDMESNGHIRKVEKAMKEALKNDRARIQVGRISSFGLMEMSRQRLRTGVLEASTKPCPHCEGSGLMRTASSAGLSALRMLEEEAARGRGNRIILRAGREAAVYVLNKKRHEIAEIEERYGVIVEVLIDDSFEGAKMTVEAVGPRPVERPRPAAIAAPAVEEEEDLLDEEEEEEDEEHEEAREERRDRREGRGDREERGEGGEGGRKRRRRRGRRGGRRRGGEGREEEGQQFRQDEAQGEAEERQPETAAAEEAPAAAQAEQQSEGEEQPRKSRRRPRARRRGEGETQPDEAATVTEAAPVEAVAAETEVAPEEPAAAKPRRGRRKKADAEAEAAPAADVPAPAAEAPVEAAEAAPPEPANDQNGGEQKPKRGRRKAAPAAPEAPVLERAEDAASETAPPADADAEGSGRRGWWQRTFGG